MSIDDDLRAALLAGARRVGHQIDLGRDGVGAPDDDAVGLRRSRRAIDAAHVARFRRDSRARRSRRRCAEDSANSAWRGVSRSMPSRMHEAHRAGVEIGPDALSAVLAARPSRNASATRSSASSQEIGANWPEPFGPVRRSGCVSRSGLMDALGVARDFRADHARRVGLCSRRRARGRSARRRSRSTSSAQTDGQSCGTDGRSALDADDSVHGTSGQVARRNICNPGGRRIQPYRLY